MSKMKHLLRKLHIGGGGLPEHHHRLGEAPPGLSPSLAAEGVGGGGPDPAARSPSPSPDSRGMGTIAAESAGGGDAGAGDFNFLEEEFQVQLALAISASSADHVEVREDPEESAQIDAAKRISLGCPAASAAEPNAMVEFLSLRYWTYNVVNYDEKVMDGFYDVYGIKPDIVARGKMPLFVDLQAISVSGDVDYEVILVNRMVDFELQQLEDMAVALSIKCQASHCGPFMGGLIQKVADVVADRMGGPVGDADEMVKRWSTRSFELRSSLKTVILPLGLLNVGLSRHRALLFKVLADRLDIPCKLVKGSYYTGTDEGAVNLIKIDTGIGRCGEYIIDLMGAPGTLIPVEVPASCLQSSNIEISPNLLDATIQTLAVGLNFEGPSHIGHLNTGDTSRAGNSTEENERLLSERNQTEIFENDFGKLLPSLHKSRERPSSISGEARQSQKVKVKNVSKYVISASKNPEFAQKLHAVLLESGASPPPDLFLDGDGLEVGKQKANERCYLAERHEGGFLSQHRQDKSFSSHGHRLPSTVVGPVESTSCAGESEMNAMELSEKLVKLDKDAATSGYSLWSESPDAASEGFVLVNSGISDMIQTSAAISGDSSQTQVGQCTTSGHNYDNAGAESSLKLEGRARASGAHVIYCNGHSETINPVLGGDAECDIRWEDLQIGERIGIGSYGEVYRAEWNGTEVAVKKFLDQDFSGEALAQFKCEVEIMLRLRHPNVVLFMGAVTRPPHFSILTEFLPRGSLYRLLHRPNPQLDERRRMRMALDVAKGMNYLHTSHPTIVHRDLKSPNLLVDKNWAVKVCDFGLSRMKHHTFLSSKSTAGTPEWMAPEVLRNEPANEKCDVYSFGVILWELATLSIPWKGLNSMQVVGAVGFQNRRLEIPEELDPTVAQIMQECWQTEPHLRPTFTQLMYRLRRLQRLVVDRKNSTS
ncbi:probable serine/threonine-protein kinase SIS8 [Syzygium oleosum]|uniref:probable serine/threonine-protein kinase SIS8 n=1 Tax=Syzygium oleosum TaxID=219896 RepID=UPI0024B9E1D3|nr:probable serine/threonine-protein kinase SIS8 [Syzygium oleosum]